MASLLFHAFAIGSFIDELAHARGVDPRRMWLDHAGTAGRAAAFIV